MLLVVTH